MTQWHRWMGQTSELPNSMQASLYVLKHSLSDYSFSSLPLTTLANNLLIADCTRFPDTCWGFPAPWNLLHLRLVLAPPQILEVTRPPHKFCKFEGGKGNVSKEARMTFSWSLLFWANALFEFVYSVKSFPDGLSLCYLYTRQTRHEMLFPLQVL